MVEDDVEINYQTFFSLAEKHDHKGGKWCLHQHNRDQKVDMIWKFIALDLVYKKFPAGVIGVKISPVNDLAVPGKLIKKIYIEYLVLEIFAIKIMIYWIVLRAKLKIGLKLKAKNKFN